MLGLPREGNHGLVAGRLTFAKRRARRRPVSIGPRGFDDDPSQVGVTCLVEFPGFSGDAAGASCGPLRIAPD